MLLFRLSHQDVDTNLWQLLDDKPRDGRKNPHKGKWGELHGNSFRQA